ncbi:MAG: hypothetical protein V4858_14965 [Pseudomonadota bacterium]
MIKSLCLAILVILPCAASALTVDQAYAAIPHQRTPFNTDASRLSRGQAEALQQLFELSDRGTVLRVDALQGLQRADASHVRAVVRDYAALLEALRQLRPTQQTRAATELVAQAVQQQQRFFETKLQAGNGGSRLDAVFTADVHQSSQKLRQAYSLLMAAFPDETARNRQAFFDHLCALDFL